MVSYDRTIPPGRRGSIKIYVDTSGYTGNLKKSLLVETDNLRIPEFTLTVKAKIISPIEVFPKSIYFVGKKKAILKTNVKILANLDKSLKIKPVSYDLEDKVRYEIKEAKKGRIYEIRFVKLPSNDRKIQGKLKLKTNYPDMPYIEIKIRGYFR